MEYLRYCCLLVYSNSCPTAICCAAVRRPRSFDLYFIGKRAFTTTCEIFYVKWLFQIYRTNYTDRLTTFYSVRVKFITVRVVRVLLRSRAVFILVQHYGGYKSSCTIRQWNIHNELIAVSYNLIFVSRNIPNDLSSSVLW